MRVSREQMAENRTRILEAASRLFRARGYDAVTVAEVMAAAGLTHGGFYRHFKSKDDLIAQMLAHTLGRGGDSRDLARYATDYLSPAHRDDLAGGCPLASLGGETLRQGVEARAAMTAGLKAQVARLSRTASGDSAAEKRQTAVASLATMVGAVLLARLSDDPALADEILQAARTRIDKEAA